jgi:hypothetical protein
VQPIFKQILGCTPKIHRFHVRRLCINALTLLDFDGPFAAHYKIPYPRLHHGATGSGYSPVFIAHPF